MIWQIIRKEFYLNIITARFVVGFIICLILISASAYVSIHVYERRLNDYNVAAQEHRNEVLNARVYSELRPRVDREPSRLSIFNQGMDNRLANTFRTEPSAVPMVYDGEKHGSYNPFLALFSSVDLAFVFQIVLSLLALLFAYDSISGEREDGTLKLMMSNSIPRSSVLIGKYLSALLSLFWPIVVSVIVALLIIVLSGKVALSGGDFLRILLIVIVSLLYVSVFYLMGLLISVKTQRTATSLVMAIFAWVFLALVYPNAGGFLVDRVIESRPGKEQYSRVEELWSEFGRKRDEYKTKLSPDGSQHTLLWPGFFGWANIGSWASYSEDTLSYSISDPMAMKGVFKPESAIDIPRQFYQHVEPLRIGTADQVWQIRKLALDETYRRKRRLTMRILRLSPVTIHDNASAILAGTDLGSVLYFVKQAQDYRRSFIQYFYDQDAFSSVKWFKYSDGETEDSPDLSGAPVFHQRSESIASSLTRSATDILLLIILNAIFFVLSLTFFVKQEIP